MIFKQSWGDRSSSAFGSKIVKSQNLGIMALFGRE